MKDKFGVFAVGGYVVLLNLKDFAANCKYAVLVHTMDTEDSAYVLHAIMGDDPVNLMYTDNRGAVIKACEARGLL
eukprot:11171153-Lingulodinium_polyedra.AAC.1